MSTKSRTYALDASAAALPATMSSSDSTGPRLRTCTGARSRSKNASCTAIASPESATRHSASPSIPSHTSARSPVTSSGSGVNPAARSAVSTATAASRKVPSWSVNRSTSSVYLSTRPCTWRALPPASATPYRRAARSATRATRRCSGWIGIRPRARGPRRALGPRPAAPDANLPRAAGSGPAGAGRPIARREGRRSGTRPGRRGYGPR
jgi:hypothetical protein